MPTSTVFGMGPVKRGEVEVEVVVKGDWMETTSVAVAICARRELGVTEEASPGPDPGESRFPMDATGPG